MMAPLPEQQPEPGPTDPAFISAEDVERAKQAWERDAPAEFRNLLDAEIRPDADA
jgi:hypothetical protein